jgi:hypothetical protein
MTLSVRHRTAHSRNSIANITPSRTCSVVLPEVGVISSRVCDPSRAGKSGRRRCDHEDQVHTPGQRPPLHQERITLVTQWGLAWAHGVVDWEVDWAWAGVSWQPRAWCLSVAVGAACVACVPRLRNAQPRLPVSDRQLLSTSVRGAPNCGAMASRGSPVVSGTNRA